jgi:small subunit ribosomal protein S16
MGKKKRPFYRLVVLDSRKRRDGAYLANLGYYNPFVEPHEVELRADEIIDWLEKGATVSDTARSLLRAEGVLHRFALQRQGLAADEIEERMSAWQQGAEARQARNRARLEADRKAEAEARARADEEKAAEAEAVAAADEDESPATGSAGDAAEAEKG